LADDETLQTQIEALIFASNGPATPAQLKRALPGLTPSRIATAVAAINAELADSGRPFEITEIAAGYQFRTRQEFGELILAGRPERRMRLSRPALETLSVIAYRQPVTRAEIEDLRCVDCGAVMKSLLDRSLIRIVGRRDAPGRPSLWGTGSPFLEAFGLKSLSELPDLREITAMDEEAGVAVESARAAPPDELDECGLDELAPAGLETGGIGNDDEQAEKVAEA